MWLRINERRLGRRTVARERGTILLGVVFVTFLLGSLSFAFLQEGLAEKVSVDHRQSSLLALQIAEKGLIEASSEVLSQTDGGSDGVGVVQGSYAGGTYEVAAAQDGTNPDRWTLTARGTHGLSTRRLEIGVRRRENSYFVEGLFSKDALTFNGSTATDAYDSRLGTYASQAVNSDGSGTYADGGGHIGSNRGITLHGSSVTIRGNAIPGPLYETSTSGGPTVWGDILPRRMEIELLPISQAAFEAAFATNDNAELLAGAGAATGGSTSNGKGKGKGGGGGAGGGGGSSPYDPTTYSLTSSGQGTIDLAGGTYFFTDVRLTGQSALRINGPTIIYVTGDFDVSGGGFVNGTGKPLDFLVHVHPYAIVPGHAPASSTVKIRGGSEASMALYAPGAALTVAGGDDLYGAYVASTITIAGNVRFHYDKALGEVQSKSEVVLERLYWRDLDERLR